MTSLQFHIFYDALELDQSKLVGADFTGLEVTFQVELREHEHQEDEIAHVNVVHSI